MIAAIVCTNFTSNKVPGAVGGQKGPSKLSSDVKILYHCWGSRTTPSSSFLAAYSCFLAVLKKFDAKQFVWCVTSF